MANVTWGSLEELRALYDHPEPGYDEPWRALNTRGGQEMEREVCEVIYALVRLIKPALIIESGAGYGLSSSWIAYALQANRHGYLVSYETDREFFQEARDNLARFPFVEVVHGSAEEWRGETPQFVVLDSRDEYRRREIERFRGVLAVVHDAHRYDLPRGIQIETYRGVWIGTL